MLTSEVKALCRRNAIFCWYLGILTNSLRTLLFVDTSSQLLLYDDELELCREDKCLHSDEVFNNCSKRCFSACNRFRASSVSVISSCVSFLVSGAFMTTGECVVSLPCEAAADDFLDLFETRALTISKICIMLFLTSRTSSFLMCDLEELLWPCIFSAQRLMCNWWNMQRPSVISSTLPLDSTSCY